MINFDHSTNNISASSGNLNINGIVPQELLVSGTNIKTINGNSIVGSGDVSISGGSADASTLTTGTLNAGRLPAFTGDVTSTAGSSTLTLAASGATAGTYKSVTVNTKGLVTSGTNPTTFSGYGISDTSANLAAAITDETGTGSLVFNTTPTFIGLREAHRIISGDGIIDLSLGNCFSRTITSAINFTVSNVPPMIISATQGTLVTFILDITNGGSNTITWWTNLKWVGGTAPTLTAAGRDSLGFYTYDAGATWTGIVLGKDIK